MTASDPIRATRSALTYLSQIVSMAVSVFGGFIITPILIRLLGTERFGIFRIINDWMANLALLELGLGGALAVTLLPAISRRNKEETASALNEGFRACVRLAGLMVFAACLLAGILPWLTPHRTVGANELRLAVLGLSFSLIFFPTSVFRTLFEVRQQGYFINLLITGQAILTLSLQLAAAYLGFGLGGVCIATAVGQLPLATVLTYKAVKLLPAFWQCPREASIRKHIWSVNWAVFVCQTMGRIGLCTDNLIVGSILGGTSVSNFYLTQRLAIVAQSQLQAIGNSTWAGLMELAHSHERLRFEEGLLELTSLVSGLGLTILIPILILNPFFFAKWMGAELYAGPAVNALVCINAWLWAIQSLWSWPIDASGNSRRTVPYAIASAALNVTVSVIATKSIGLAGPLLGTLLAFLLISSWSVPKILHQLFEIRPAALISAALQPLLWGMPWAVASWFSVSAVPPRTWAAIVLEAVIMGTTGLALWWWFTCTQKSRERWLSRLQVLPKQAISLMKA